MTKKILKVNGMTCAMCAKTITNTFENYKGITANVNVGAGKVIFASYKGNSGKLVIVQHKNGYQTIYAHLDKINTKKGKTVKQGDLIGSAGNTGVSTGPHLHFGVRKNGKFVNPMNFLN